MDIRVPPDKFDDRQPTIQDMLVRLVESQKEAIARLTTENKTLKDANATLGGELLAASEERAQALVSLAQGVGNLRRKTDLVVKQRDAVLRALRGLCTHLSNQPITSLTYFGGDAFANSFREAAELLKVLDQLREQAERERVRGQDGDSSGVTPGTGS